MQPSSDLGDRLAQIPAENLVLIQENQLRNANFRIHQLEAEVAMLKASSRIRTLK
jgi:hypothetical protein